MDKSLLEKLKTDRPLCSVFDDESEEDFYGYIADYSDELIQISHFDSNGIANGTLVLQLADVPRIRWGGRDLDRVEELITHPPEHLSLNLESLRTAALSLQERCGYVYVTLGEIDVGIATVGVIENDSETTLLLHEYGTRQTSHRSHCIIKWSAISRVEAGSVYQESLHRYHLKHG